MLGQVVKEKARYYQLQRHQQPDLITVKISELDERVRGSFCFFTRAVLMSSVAGEGARHLRNGAVLALEAIRSEWL